MNALFRTGMMTNDELQMRITWICPQDATVQSQMGLLTDRICSETLVSTTAVRHKEQI